MKVQQPVFHLLSNGSAAEDESLNSACLQTGEGLFLPSPSSFLSQDYFCGRNLTCSGTVSAVCCALKRREFLCLLPPLFAVLTLIFCLLFLAVKRLFFLPIYFPHAVSAGKWGCEGCKKTILKGWQSLT